MIYKPKYEIKFFTYHVLPKSCFVKHIAEFHSLISRNSSAKYIIPWKHTKKGPLRYKFTMMVLVFLAP